MTSYATALKSWPGNKIYNLSANDPPERPQKKIMIQLDNNFPMLDPQPFTSAGTNPDNTSLGTTSNYNTQGTSTKVSENTIKETNKKVKQKLKEIKEAQEIKMAELENKICLELQPSITTAVENSAQLFNSSIASMVEKSFK
eukprot:3728676-Ditylum_brightwellii.AAC.1